MTMLYVLPQYLSLLLEMLILFYIIQNKLFQYRYSILWYLNFVIILFLVCASREYVLINSSVKSSCHCLLMVVTIVSIIRERSEIELFIKSFSFYGVFFCFTLFPMIEYAMQGHRLQNTESEIGYLANAVSIGYSLMFIAIAQLWSIPRFEKRLHKIVMIILFCITFFLILLSGTRKALIAPLIFIFLQVYYKYKYLRCYLIAIFLLIVLAIYFGIDYILHNEMMYSIIGNRIEGLFGVLSNDYKVDDSTLIRMSLINKAWKLLLSSNILFGVGVNTTIATLGTHAHNNYLTILCFGGIILFVSYYWFIISLFIKNIKSDNIDVLNRFFTCLFVAIFFIDATATTYNINLFVLFIALAEINQSSIIREDDI